MLTLETHIISIQHKTLFFLCFFCVFFSAIEIGRNLLKFIDHMEGGRLAPGLEFADPEAEGPTADIP